MPSQRGLSDFGQRKNSNHPHRVEKLRDVTASQYFAKRTGMSPIGYVPRFTRLLVLTRKSTRDKKAAAIKINPEKSCTLIGPRPRR